MPTAIFTVVTFTLLLLYFENFPKITENFRQITSLFGDFDEFPRKKLTFWGVPPSLKCLVPWGTMTPFSRDVRGWYPLASKMT